METNEALKLEEELLIDPETGEIVLIDGIPLSASQSICRRSVDDIPKYARAMRAVQRRIDMIREFRKAEISRIVESCDDKIEKLTKQVDTLHELVRIIAKPTGEKKLEYPGIGFFRFGTTRESIDDSEYQDMTDDEKKKLHNNYQGCFRSKTVTTPDKKWIKGSIEQGKPVPGFVIKDKEETFTFHKED